MTRSIRVSFTNYIVNTFSLFQAESGRELVLHVLENLVEALFGHLQILLELGFKLLKLSLGVGGEARVLDLVTTLLDNGGVVGNTSTVPGEDL